MTPKVSGAVCTHSGARTLPATIAALRSQDVPAGEFEVMVVDDGTTDGTGAVARPPGAEVVALTPNQGLAAARNAAVAAAHAEIIAFTDDDCVPSEDSLRQITIPFSHGSIDAVAGGVMLEPTNALVRDFLELANPLRALPAEHAGSPGNLDRLKRYVLTAVTSTWRRRDSRCSAS